MQNRIETETESRVHIAEYILIGAGPAAICAIPNILNNGVAKTDIVWIDPQFKVGDFGTTLSVGSSVPGNTAVVNYQKVNNEIYRMVPECTPREGQLFKIDDLEPTFVCSLKVAAQPMQYITNELRKLVRSIKGSVVNISSTEEGLSLEITLPDGSSKYIISKRVIIATGAKARNFKLSDKHNDVTMIDPNVAFIESELLKYLASHPGITTVAVIGSSHSAALATMHLLKAGLTVKQFMNKEYKYATPCESANGTKYTMYDNTGLKGDVAKFTRQLQDDIKSDKSEYEYKGKIKFYVGKDHPDVSQLLEENLSECSHAVAAIGYQPSETLQVNGMSLSTLLHDNRTTEFIEIRGLFGIGIAFPQQVKAISGEIEYAVGIGKFWATASNPNVLETWKNSYVDNVHAENLSCTDVVSHSRLFKPARQAAKPAVESTTFQLYKSDNKK